MKRIDFQDPTQVQTYNAHLFRFISFSNVSSCVRRDILEKLPFSETIVMVEDQEWCKRAIESGYWVFYESGSVVYHSHNHSLKMVYKRHFGYGMSLREFAPFPITLKDVLFYTIFESLGDIAFILGRGKAALSNLGWIVKSPLVRIAMRYGLYRGFRWRSHERVVRNFSAVQSNFNDKR